MPNHVTHRVVVSGPPADVAAFKARAFASDEEAPACEAGRLHFDFGAFVPRPKCLDSTTSGYGLSPEELAANAAALAETGYANWYDWARDNWGTTWNSYAFAIERHEPGEVEFVFDSAWSVPKPVFEKAADEFRTLTFRIEAYDEGDMFGAVGAYVGGVGAVEARKGLATDALYERVYGHKRPVYDEDGEEVEPSEAGGG